MSGPSGRGRGRGAVDGYQGYQGETELISPVGDDVVRMHGQVWRVRARALVAIEAITDPAGASLGAANWRSSYVGAFGRASFADMGEGGLWVAQVRDLAYPDGEGGLRCTCDILRSSSGMLDRDDAAGAYTLVTKRTRYVFRLLVGDEAVRVGAAIDGR